MSTETVRLIRDGEKGGGKEVTAVLTENALLYCSGLLFGILKTGTLQKFRVWPWCCPGHLIAIFEGGWVDSCAVSVCWCQKVLQRHGWDVVLSNFVERDESLLLPVLLQWWWVQLLEHVSPAPWLSRLAVLME